MAEIKQQNGVPNNETSDQIKLEEEEVKQGNKNPLKNEVVVRNLLSFLSLRDLKSCRLVNSLWNMSSIPYLKQKCSYVNFDKFSWKKDEHLRMAKFIRLLRSSSNFPCVKLVVGTSVENTRRDDTALLLDLLSSISPVITELMISEQTGYSFNSLFRDNIPEKLDFPSLKTLTLFATNTDKERPFGFISFITSILTNTPVLDKLVLVDYGGYYVQRTPNNTTLIRLLESIAKCLKISTLEIRCKIGKDDLIFLSKMGLKLRALFISFLDSKHDQESLKMFLQSQSTTLQTLEIVAFFSSRCEVLVDFPCMKRLESLMITGQYSMSFPNISYAKQFPALKRLSISDGIIRVEDFLRFGIQPVTTVQELILAGTYRCLDADSFQHAARIFPNIKLLEVDANIEFLKIAYDSMPNIEELILDEVLDFDLDEIITGVTGLKFEEINHDLATAMNYMLQLHATWKPISCLKKLKILRLKPRKLHNDDELLELTDASCHVLMRMPSLQCVDFYGRCPYKISEGVLLMNKRIMVL